MLMFFPFSGIPEVTDANKLTATLQLCWLHSLKFGQIQYRGRGDKHMGSHGMGHNAVKNIR